MHGGGEQHPKGKIKRGFKYTVPWVMWWACLTSDDEFDGVPAALAVLHQDRHRILPTRQRPGQWLARSLPDPHPFHTTCPKDFPHTFSWPLIDGGGERKYNTLQYNVFFWADSVCKILVSPVNQTWVYSTCSGEINIALPIHMLSA